ncbi:MAG TPA: hypothetical protein VG317_04715 [Pseudonocardiaceae bacterium]|jgi:hypothetical protein|nr:hypothetical protein [Pseudonocardiaceae bacterium]
MSTLIFDADYQYWTAYSVTEGGPIAPRVSAAVMSVVRGSITA